MQDLTKYNLHIISLMCYRQEESNGDEVFLKYNTKRIWPIDMKYSQVTEGTLDLSLDIAGIDKGQIVNVELWDYDLITANDNLGVFSMLVNERGGPFTTDLNTNKNDAKYTLKWEVT